MIDPIVGPGFGPVEFIDRAGAYWLAVVQHRSRPLFEGPCLDPYLAVWRKTGRRIEVPAAPTDATGELRAAVRARVYASLTGRCRCGGLLEVVDGSPTMTHAVGCVADDEVFAAMWLAEVRAAVDARVEPLSRRSPVPVMTLRRAGV